MFAQQLTAELVPTLPADNGDSLNDCGTVRRLLERHTGFTQFRIVLPGQVILSDGLSEARGGGVREISLQDAVHSYMPEDQVRVIEVITEAIKQRKGYRFTGRRKVGDQIRIVETIADVKIENDQVTEIVGLSRDISDSVEREALAISRARLIRRMVEDMPVPVVVLDRGLKVVACSAAWAKSHGLRTRGEALGRPLNKLIEVSNEITSAIIQAMKGRSAQFNLPFYSAEDGRPMQWRMVVTSWQCGSDASGGVLMMAGEENPPYATLEVADRAFGRRTRGLLEMLEGV
jgi:PAS domain-containing protein